MRSSGFRRWAAAVMIAEDTLCSPEHAGVDFYDAAGPGDVDSPAQVWMRDIEGRAAEDSLTAAEEGPATDRVTYHECSRTMPFDPSDKQVQAEVNSTISLTASSAGSTENAVNVGATVGAQEQRLFTHPDF